MRAWKVTSASRVFLIDVDGVACEHAKAICSRVNRDYGLASTVEDVTTWNHDFGPVTFVQAVEKYYPNDDFVLSMEVTPGFGEFLSRLKRLMVVRFASARQYSHDATRLWVNQNFGEYEVRFARTKTDLEFDYLLDDSLEEVIEAARKGKTCFLFRRPWNDNELTRSTVRKFKRLYSVERLSEILAIV